jgi:alpha-glucosidase
MSKTIYKDLVNTIHIRDQYYIIIVNPTIFYKESNPALKTSLEYSIFIKENNRSKYQGVI